MKDWILVNCGNVIDVRDGTHDSPKYVENGFPLVTSKNLINGKLSLNEVSHISQNDFENINKRSKVDIGDILYSMIGSIGNYALMEEEPNFAIKNVALFKFNNDQVFNKFFYHLLNSSSVKKQIENQQKGGTQKFVSLSILRNLEIPLPPLATQKKIAAILDAADAYRQKTKTLIDKYDQLAQSLFLDMFGDPYHNPKQWKWTTIKKITKIVKGITYSPEQVDNSGIIVLRSSNVQKGILDLKDLVRINKNVDEKFWVQRNDILMCNRNGSPKLVGKVAKIPEIVDNMTFGTFMTIVRSSYYEYLYSFFQTNAFRLQIKMQTTVAINQISIPLLENVKVPFPPIALQNQFAERIQLIEAQKQQAQASLQKAEDLFNSLLQRAFKGELVV